MSTASVGLSKPGRKRGRYKVSGNSLYPLSANIDLEDGGKHQPDKIAVLTRSRWEI